MPKHRIGTRSPLLVTVAVLLCATAVSATNQEEQKASSGHERLLFRLETAQWSPPYEGPLGYPKGAQRASLGVDPVSGGETYYARFPAGSEFRLHWHSHDEYAVVLRGRVTHTLGTVSQSLSPGDYVIIPAKVNHGWKVDPGNDVFLLIRRKGPADFNFVAPQQ